MSRIYRTLGTVAMTPKGEYDSSAYYEKLNIVEYEGSSYVAKQNVNNILPTNEIYWLYLGGGVKITDTLYVFDTVAAMKASTKLKNGFTAQTLGYYSINDGGGATYKITDIESETEYQETVGSLYATLIVDNPNVKQFGAYGDGVHNDTVAIRNAFNSVKEININNGTYLTNSITLNDKQHVIGNNAILQLKDNTENNKIFLVESDDILIENITFKGLVTENDYSTQSTNFGIRLSGNNNKIINCNFYNFGRDGIYLNNASNIEIKDCHFEHCNTNAIASVQELSHIKILNNIFLNNPYHNINFENDNPALKVNDVIISNNSISWEALTIKSNCSWGINIGTSASVTASSNKYSDVLVVNNILKNVFQSFQARLINNLNISNNELNNCNRIFSIDAAGNADLYQENIILDKNICNIAETTSSGIIFLYVKNGVISNNTILNCAKNHVIVLSNTINTLINGNYISESEKRGVSLQGYTQKTNIINNYFNNLEGGCVYLTYAQTDPLYLTIDNNIFEDTKYNDTYLIRSTQSDRKNVVLSNFTKIVGNGISLGLQIRTNEFDQTTCKISTTDKYS